MQNDAVRLQVGAENEALKTENKQLRTRIDHLLLENDQYRRTLAGRPRGEGAER
jgi:regulator of replication initiation timing